MGPTFDHDNCVALPNNKLLKDAVVAVKDRAVIAPANVIVAADPPNTPPLLN
jgi:hypothetical protein